MPASRRILAAAASAAALALTAAAPAGAASVTTLRCIAVTNLSEVKNMPVAGAGFTPNDQVIVRYQSPFSLAPTFLTAVQTDATGSFSTSVSPPPFDTRATATQTFDLSAVDGFNVALVAKSTYHQVRFGYTTQPATGVPTRMARHTVRGFPVGKDTYLHFRYRGRTRRTVKLGRAAAPCGTVSRRLALLPVKARAGVWTIYVDQARSYSRNTTPQLSYSLPIG